MKSLTVVHAVLAALVVFQFDGGSRHHARFGAAVDAADVEEQVSKNQGTNPQQPPRVVTKEELATKNTTADGNELWLAILGEVYNVTAGARYYKEGASYHVFVGRDGSAAFVTGNFTPAGAEASLYESLKDEELSQLETWREFYANEEKYPFVGYLVGELYDENGQPKAELERVNNAIVEGKKKLAERTRLNKEKAAQRRKEAEEKKKAKLQQEQEQKQKVEEEL